MITDYQQFAPKGTVQLDFRPQGQSTHFCHQPSGEIFSFLVNFTKSLRGLLPRAGESVFSNVKRKNQWNLSKIAIIVTRWSVVRVGAKDEINWRTKFSLDCPCLTALWVYDFFLMRPCVIPAPVPRSGSWTATWRNCNNNVLLFPRKCRVSKMTHWERRKFLGREVRSAV